MSIQTPSAISNHRLQSTGFFALAMMGAYLGTSAIASVFITFFPNSEHTESLMTIFLYLLGFFIPCLIYGLIIRSRTGQRLTDTLSMHRLPFASVLICIFLGFLIQPPTSLIAQASSMVFQDITSISVTSQVASIPLWEMLLTTALMPALFEEILCRGILYDGCKNCPVWYQLLIPACFFGFLHMNFQQISYALPMGIFMAFILYVTGSIFSTMIIHFTLNGTQVACAWLNENLGWFEGNNKVGTVFITIVGGSENIRITALIAGIALVLIGLMVFLLFRIHQPAKREKRQIYAGWHEGGWILGLIIGFLFVCALLIELLLPYISLFE